MRINTVSIRGFKSLRDLNIEINDMLVLIGANNAGKFNILEALDLFFTPSRCSVSSDMFYQLGNENCEEIEITVEFEQLTNAEKERFSKHLERDKFRVRRVARREQSEDNTLGDGSLGPFLSVVQKPNDPLLCKKKSEINSTFVQELEDKYSLPSYVQGMKGATVTNVKDNWETLREELSKIEGMSSEFEESTVIGYPAVAQGNLPKFLWLPAVKDATDELKITQKTLFGEVFKQILDTEALGFAATVREKLDEIHTALNPTRSEGSISESDAISIFESEITELYQDHMPDTTVHLGFHVPTMEKILLSGSIIRINDGFLSTLEHKGHGAQRLFMLSLLRLYAKRLVLNSGESERTFILAIEEPEIYLHPPAQRKLFSILKSISSQRQVILCTHSPYFINMPEYRNICVVSRSRRDHPTSVFQTNEDLFNASERDDFKLISQIDPTRSEIFFSKKVILVEGDTERLTLPIVAERMEIDFASEGVTVIESGGKTIIPFFMTIMNTFNIPYLVIYDEDPFEEPDDITALDEVERSKLSGKRRIYAFNERIETEKGDNGHTLMVSGDYEKLLGVSRSQSDKKGKSLAAYRKLKEINLSDIDSGFLDSFKEFLEGN